MADWNAIKAEYIAGGISMRKLATKHGVPFPTLRDRAIREEWTQGRNTVRNRIVEETAQKTANTAASNAVRAERIREKLLIKLEKEIDALPDSMGSQSQQAIIDNAYDDKSKRLKQTKEARKEFSLRDLTTSFLNLTKDMDTNKSEDQVRIIIDV